MDELHGMENSRGLEQSARSDDSEGQRFVFYDQRRQRRRREEQRRQSVTVHLSAAALQAAGLEDEPEPPADSGDAPAGPHIRIQA